MMTYESFVGDMPVKVERIQAQIMAYQWFQGRVQDLVINSNESKNTKIRI